MSSSEASFVFSELDNIEDSAFDQGNQIPANDTSLDESTIVQLQHFMAVQVKTDISLIKELEDPLRSISVEHVTAQQDKIAKSGYQPTLGTLAIVYPPDFDVSKVPEHGTHISINTLLVDGRHRLHAMKNLAKENEVWNESTKSLVVTLWMRKDNSPVSKFDALSIGSLLNELSTNVKAMSFHDKLYASVSVCRSLRSDGIQLLTPGVLTDALQRGYQLGSLSRRQLYRHAQVALKIYENDAMYNIIMKAAKSSPRMSLIHVTSDALLQLDNPSIFQLCIDVLTRRLEVVANAGRFDLIRATFYSRVIEVASALERMASEASVTLHELLQQSVSFGAKPATLKMFFLARYSTFATNDKDTQKSHASRSRQVYRSAQSAIERLKLNNNSGQERQEVQQPTTTTTTTPGRPNPPQSPQQPQPYESHPSGQIEAHSSRHSLHSHSHSNSNRSPPFPNEISGSAADMYLGTGLQCEEESSPRSAKKSRAASASSSSFKNTGKSRKGPLYPGSEVKKPATVNEEEEEDSVSAEEIIDLDAPRRSSRINQPNRPSIHYGSSSSSPVKTPVTKKPRTTSALRKVIDKSKTSGILAKSQLLASLKSLTSGELEELMTQLNCTVIPSFVPDESASFEPSGDNKFDDEVPPFRLSWFPPITASVRPSDLKPTIYPNHPPHLFPEAPDSDSPFNNPHLYLQHIHVPLQHRAHLAIRDSQRLLDNHRAVYILATANQLRTNGLVDAIIEWSNAQGHNYNDPGIVAAKINTVPAVQYFSERRTELYHQGYTVLKGLALDKHDEYMEVEMPGGKDWHSRLREFYRLRFEKFEQERRSFQHSMNNSNYNDDAFTRSSDSALSEWVAIANEGGTLDERANREGASRFMSTKHGVTTSIEQTVDTKWVVECKAGLDARIGQCMAAMGVNYNYNSQKMFMMKTGGRWIRHGKNCARQQLHTDVPMGTRREILPDTLYNPGFFSIVTGESDSALWIVPYSHRLVSAASHSSIGALARGVHAMKITIPPWSIFFGRGDVFHAGPGFGDVKADDGRLRYHTYFLPDGMELPDSINLLQSFNPSFKVNYFAESDDEQDKM